MTQSTVLQGCTVVVTRAEHQRDELVAALERLGAQVEHVPLLEMTTDAAGLDTLRNLLTDPDQSLDGVVVTSPNGARCLAEAWRVSTGRPPAVYAVGPGTAAALESAGGPAATAVATRHLAEGLVELLGPGRGRLVVAQGDLARPVLVDELRQAGWSVQTVTVYRTVVRVPSPHQVHRMLAGDLITLASGSAAIAWAQASPPHLSPGVVVMGPITAHEARVQGLPVVGMAEPHTLDGLVDAVVRAANDQRRGGSEPAS
jgi:uroporphyrinogen-III synthase